MGITEKIMSGKGSNTVSNTLNKLKGGVKVKTSSAPKVNVGKAPDLTKKIL